MEFITTWVGSLIIAIISFAVYVYPLWRASSISEEAVLDEMYLLDTNRPNRDVQGISSLAEVFRNDYWGRPLAGASSHKSWRPMTVMSLRYLNNQSKSGLFFQNSAALPPIFFHRMINAILHTILSHVVGILAVRMFVPRSAWQARTLQWLAVLIFALHPVHVEAVANAANRPHLLAMMFSLCTVDSSVPTSIVVWTMGLLCSETMVFLLPATILTSGLIHWRKDETQKTSTFVLAMLPRVVLWTLATFVYLLGRYVTGSLVIPEGLLQRAETPFGHLQGLVRIRSYAYVTAIHVGKSFGIDPIGFAHEYSYNCVAPLTAWADPRIAGPIGMAALASRKLWKLFQQRKWDGLMMWLIALAWMATLFPIMGFLKVGTFIADRMVLPSTFVISVFGAQYVATQLHRQSSVLAKSAILVIVGSFLLGFWAPRVVKRTKDWTRHRYLFGTTRKTCPKSAKNLLQLSKLYSGNDPDLLDLNQSMYVHSLARSIVCLRINVETHQ